MSSEEKSLAQTASRSRIVKCPKLHFSYVRTVQRFMQSSDQDVLVDESLNISARCSSDPARRDDDEDASEEEATEDKLSPEEVKLVTVTQTVFNIVFRP